MKDIFHKSLHVIGLMQIDHSLEFSTSNALTIYCLQGYFRPASLANSFTSFWICPDIVEFKENKSEILAFAQSKFAHWQQRQKEQNKMGANISQYTVIHDYIFKKAFVLQSSS